MYTLRLAIVAVAVEESQKCIKYMTTDLIHVTEMTVKFELFVHKSYASNLV